MELMIPFVLAATYGGYITPIKLAVMLLCFFLWMPLVNWTYKDTQEVQTKTTQWTTAIILAGAVAFGQVLANTGASRGLSQFVIGFNLAPLMLVIAMMLVVLILGTFLGAPEILMITLPIFLPIINAIGFSLLQFGLLLLVNLEVALTTPPFGLLLFVMKGVAPPDTTISDIWKASTPFITCDVVSMAIILNFPIIATFLPKFMIY